MESAWAVGANFNRAKISNVGGSFKTTALTTEPRQAPEPGVRRAAGNVAARDASGRCLATAAAGSVRRAVRGGDAEEDIAPS